MHDQQNYYWGLLSNDLGLLRHVYLQYGMIGGRLNGGLFRTWVRSPIDRAIENSVWR